MSQGGVNKARCTHIPGNANGTPMNHTVATIHCSGGGGSAHQSTTGGLGSRDGLPIMLACVALVAWLAGNGDIVRSVAWYSSDSATIDELLLAQLLIDAARQTLKYGIVRLRVDQFAG